MTGGWSLGLRTGSYGSLQQNLQKNGALPMRKSSKLLSVPREKERFLQRIFRISNQRRLEILLLSAVSITIVMIVMGSTIKDGDIPEGPDMHPMSGVVIQTRGPRGTIMSSHSASPLNYGEKDGEDGTLLWRIQSVTGNNTDPPLTPYRPPVVVDVEAALPRRHRCENFSFPPPPADRKRTGPRPCPVCYLPVEEAMAYMPIAPTVSPVLKNLTYVVEDTPSSVPTFGGSPFGGYPSLKQRNDSFNVKESMSVYCGFVKGNKPGRLTGFDMDDADLYEMEQCDGIVVASAIFGNYDTIQQPKHISEAAKRNVCFFMFVDEETEASIKNFSTLDSTSRIGLWRIVVVRNIPYSDSRRTGKIPKLLLHRIFPNARFSIWIDGKLELVADPYQILERFLWRENASFAISRHYKRFDVFEEAEANKAAGKYNNASIDFQLKFYMQEGLTHYTSAKLPITSDVPEGCVIIREHIPITNLFTCNWFNEVDRFTSRDQISFSTVRDKIMAKVNWSVNMFMDCERRNFVVQGYHRDVLEQLNTAAAAIPPPSLTREATEKSPAKIALGRAARTSFRKNALMRGREKRSSTKRTGKVIGRDNNSFRNF